MLKTSGSTESITRPGKGRVGVGDDDGGGRSGDFDVTFQVTRWRSGYYLCTGKAVAFDCASIIKVSIT